MTVIAMTREMGTRGKDVAAGLAERLDIGVVHHELVERHLAERLQIAESEVHRFLEGEASLWSRWRIDTERLSHFTADEILQLAERGAVLIRGWGAAQLLSDIPHVICVRVCAPMERRFAEMKRRLGLDDEAVVRREIERNDDAHARAVQGLFRIDWRDPSNYDLVDNTGEISIDASVALIERLARSEERQPTEASRAILADCLLKARIRAVLMEPSDPSLLIRGMEIAVNDGAVTLSGAILVSEAFEAAIAAIKEIDGVRSVADATLKLRSPRSYYSITSGKFTIFG